MYSLSNAPLDNTTVTLATSTPVAPWELEFKVGATKTDVELQEPRRLRQLAWVAAPTRPTRCIGMPIHANK